MESLQERRRRLDRERKRRARFSLSQQQREEIKQQRRQLYNNQSQERIDLLRAQNRERMQAQREQQTEEVRGVIREEKRRRIALFRQNERQRRNDRLNMYRFDNNNYNERNIVTHFCGEMNVICTKCQAKHFAGEKPSDGLFNNCCHKGKVTPAIRREFPPYLMSLLSNPADPHYSHFKDKIRNYNASLSFASMGAKIVQPNGRGPYTFRVHGQIYHRTSHMHPNDDQDRQFAQLYVIDSEQATDIRSRNP